MNLNPKIARRALADSADSDVKAVVGSSAITTDGYLAMAITTRWRMPPDISWGNWR